MLGIFSVVAWGLHALPSYIYSGAYYLLNVRYFLSSNILALRLIKDSAEYASKIPQLPDAPPGVMDFCRERCALHNLPIDKIHIKVGGKSGFMEAFGSEYLLMSSGAINELHKALSETNKSEASENIIKIYAMLLDHEIAHLKNNDSFKRVLFAMGTNAATYMLMRYSLNSSRFNSFFRRQESASGLVKSFFVCDVAAIFTSLLNSGAFILYIRSQEKAADAYAINMTQDPQALRLFASFFQNRAENLMLFLEGALVLGEHCPLATRAILNFLRDNLRKQYDREKPSENFRLWLEKHRIILDLITFISDPAHPSAVVREEVARAAAERLEAQEKIPEAFSEAISAA